MSLQKSSIVVFGGEKKSVEVATILVRSFLGAFYDTEVEPVGKGAAVPVVFQRIELAAS